MGRNLAVRQGEMMLKVLSFHTLPVLTVGAQLLVFWLSARIAFFPGADALSNILSTGSEIIAGLYGITMAGYTFFLSRIDALMAADGTLDYVVRSIKTRFKYLIWYITGNVLMTLFISIVLLYCPVPAGEQMGYLYRLFCNEFILFVAFSIGLILYYSILVIDPNSIEKEAARLKKRLGGRRTVPGSAVEFIGAYDRIEDACNAMLPQTVLHQLHENKGKHFELTLELLQEQKKLPRALVQDLTRIHRYYECMINCSPMTASQEMCTLAGNVLLALGNY